MKLKIYEATIIVGVLFTVLGGWLSYTAEHGTKMFDFACNLLVTGLGFLVLSIIIKLFCKKR